MYQFSYIPYFPTSQSNQVDIKVNRVHFFNFWAFKDKYITNTDRREDIQKLCEMYIDNDGSPVNQMTIAVIDDNYEFLPLSSEQIDDLNRYARAMLFCTIINNRQHSVCCSENFKLFHQNFSANPEHIAYETGSYYRIKNGWVSVQEKRFLRPENVPTNQIHFYDERLFQALANAIDAHTPTDDFLFDTLDWVRLASSNNEEQTMANRLVMLCTAFEVFFQLPKTPKEETFVNKLEALLEVSKMTPLYQSPAISPLPRLTKDNRSKTNTIYGWWARDFYWVRSEIVHKGKLHPSDYKNHNQVSYHELALKMLRFCYYKDLQNRSYLVYETNPEFGSFSNAQELFSIIDLRKIETLIK
jgi:hypothetical protein